MFNMNSGSSQSFEFEREMKLSAENPCYSEINFELRDNRWIAYLPNGEFRYADNPAYVELLNKFAALGVTQFNLGELNQRINPECQ